MNEGRLFTALVSLVVSSLPRLLGSPVSAPMFPCQPQEKHPPTQIVILMWMSAG